MMAFLPLHDSHHAISQRVNAVYIGRAYYAWPNYFDTYPMAGTPHTHHYTCTALALRAGKHVLCEKPFTCNAAELKSLISIAKENNVFLMEVCVYYLTSA